LQHILATGIGAYTAESLRTIEQQVEGFSQMSVIFKNGDSYQNGDLSKFGIKWVN
jgi:hypothetical protein